MVVAVLPVERDGALVKRCCRCKQDVPVERFNRNIRMASGLHPACRDCRNVPAARSRARSRFIDRTGERYGRLVITGYAGQEDKPGHSRRWRCRCECGAEAVFSWKQLQANHARSCGCLFREHLATIQGKNALALGESAFNQLYGAYQKSARARGYEFSLAREEFRVLTREDCFYCGASPGIKFRAAKGTNGDYIGNGVDRIDSARGYVPGNVRSCCTRCNVAKATMSEGEFADWIARAYEHFVRQARFEHGERG